LSDFLTIASGDLEGDQVTPHAHLAARCQPSQMAGFAAFDWTEIKSFKMSDQQHNGLPDL
jgi:hypothetical protein